MLATTALLIAIGAVILSLAVLFIIARQAVVMKRLHQRLQGYQQQTEAQWHSRSQELSGLAERMAEDSSEEALIEQHSQQLQALAERQQQLAEQLDQVKQQIAEVANQDPEMRYYQKAAKLIAEGASLQEVMDACELPQAEVELLMSLNKQPS
ncbi:DUF2802 domain-containing protein [Idiomarina tyrosinivorans]|uniref:DUF2802 domain-containing protein n=1 Tax=Idiomarina tyrosinivorans TaxID=1445662 RepID=A0A432ZPH7_9GAMM|nr:DUF2802 domain-containing protein [Idiomarina tyrosinivorans]RUO79797.1 DUF2802 domain-containing protein [Idiomarina tyrosinivorans]